MTGPHRAALALLASPALTLALAACGDGGAPHGDDAGDCLPRDGIHALCLTIGDDDWTTLHADPDASLEVPVDAVIDGEPHPGAVIELHGGYARRVAKKSYRLKLSSGDRTAVPLFADDSLGGGAAGGHRRLVLQAAWIDPTFVRNKLALDLVRDGGGLAPRVDFVRLYVNGAYHGFYTLIERIDRPWLERQGLDPDGNLYKAEGNDADWRAKDDYMVGYDHERGDHPTDDLAALLDAATFTPTTDADFAASVEPLLDLDDVLIYQRTHSYAENRDAYTKNYLLYHDVDAAPDSAAARFRLISWDADAVFGRRWDGVDIPSDETAWHGWDSFAPRLLAVPGRRAQYLADYAAALDDLFTPEALDARLDAMLAVISDAATEDLATWQPDVDFAAAVDHLRQSFATRHAVMTGVIDDLGGDLAD